MKIHYGQVCYSAILLYCVCSFRCRLLDVGLCDRLKAAGAKLEDEIKSVTEEIEQYVELLTDY